MRPSTGLIVGIVLTLLFSQPAAAKQYNVILILADDISAREFPAYESTEWYGDQLARTPVLDRLVEDGGCFVETVWAATICKPSRAQIISGRYAHHTKWWDNRHLGSDSRHTYSAYKSSRVTLGTLSRDAGYANLWVGKTHINDGGDTLSMGFNEGVFTPAETKRYPGWNPYGTPTKNPYPIFYGNNPKAWDYESFYWWPEVQLINHPDHPNEPYRFLKTDINDYGPDIELDHAMAFMQRSVNNDKPFFVFYAPHLGHTAIDHADRGGSKSVWVGTPKIEFRDDGSKYGQYRRFDPHIEPRGDGTHKHTNVTPQGINTHIEYLDYQIWLLIQKLRDLGELENTVILFTADNATQGAGKGSIRRQEGTHVPLFIYAPGEPELLTGRRPIVSDFSDFLPTLADLMDTEVPESERGHGVSLWPYLTGQTPGHRDWIYSMRIDAQMIRNNEILRDGFGDWYDARTEPDDHNSFVKLDDLPDGPEKDRLLTQKPALEKVLAEFDLYAVDSEAPLPPADQDGDGLSDAFEQQYTGSATAMKPQADADGDGTDNYHEFVFLTDPTDPSFPTATQKPHLIEVTDAQGTHLALQFRRRTELGPDYWCNVEGTRDGGRTWATDGVIQVYSRKLASPDLEIVTARVAADISASTIKDLRLTVHKPKPRQPRKVETMFKN
ncbi:MAG: sulfatase-like hydrolase/transferase [Planctomycetota bacterium]